MNTTQLQFVKDKLNEDGMISRNHCLRNYISRLSAIILKLKNEGYIFTTYISDNNDYIYSWEGFKELEHKGCEKVKDGEKIRQLNLV